MINIQVLETGGVAMGKNTYSKKVWIVTDRYADKSHFYIFTTPEDAETFCNTSDIHPYEAFSSKEALDQWLKKNNAVVAG